MALPVSQEHADELLRLGQITPETHGLLSANIGDAVAAPANDAFSAGAASAGIAPPSPATAPTTSPPAADPFAVGAAKAGIGPTDNSKSYNDFGPVTGVAGQPLPSSVPPPQAPGPVPPPADVPANDNGTPVAKPVGPAAMVPSTPAPSSREPSRNDVADGMGIPSPGRVQGPSKDPRVNNWMGQWRQEFAPVQAARDAQVAAGETTLRLEQDRDIKLTEQADRFVAESEAASTRAAQEDADHQSAASEQRKAIRLAADDAAATKIDANRFWNSKTSEERTMAAIYIGLGQFTATWNHRTENVALKIIDTAIARDIQAQEKNLDNKWKKVDSERGILGDLRQVYNDNRMARADAYKRSYDLTIARGDAIVAGSKSPIAAAKWEELKAGLDAKSKEHEFEVLQGYKQRAAQIDAAAAGAQAAQRAAERKFFMERYGKTLDASLDEMKKSAEDGRAPQPWALQTAQAAARLGIPMPSGDSNGISEGRALAPIPKEERAEAIKERGDKAKAVAAATKLDQLYAEWRKLPATAGPWDRDRERIAAGIKTEIKKGAGPGMSSDKDQETFIEPITPKFGDSDATIANKQRQATSGVVGSAPTPTWDRYGQNPLPGSRSAQSNTAPKGPAKGLD